MKTVVKPILFLAVLLSLAVGCQSKKTESTQAADTTTVIESEAIVSGNTAEIITDTAKFVPDSVRK